MTSCCHHLFVAKTKRKKEEDNDMVVPKRDIAFFALNKNKKMKEEKKWKHKKKTMEEKKKCRKGREITFLLLLLHLGWSALFALSSPCSFNFELSTFLKPCVSCLLEALSYSSSGALPSSGNGVSGKWGEGGKRGVGGVNFGAEKRAGKSLGKGQGCVFGFIPKTAWRASSWTGAVVAAGSLQLSSSCGATYCWVTTNQHLSIVVVCPWILITGHN